MPKITKDISLSSKPVFIGTPCIFLIYFADEMNVKPGYRPWLVQKCSWGLSAGYQLRPQVVDRGTTARYGGQLRYI